AVAGPDLIRDVPKKFGIAAHGMRLQIGSTCRGPPCRASEHRHNSEKLPRGLASGFARRQREMKTTYSGSRHCESVRFEVDADFEHERVCDGSICRKRRPDPLGAPRDLPPALT